MNVCLLRILFIFVLSDLYLGSEVAHHSKGFFYCPPHKAVVRFRPERETLGKDLTAGMATVFNLAYVKNLPKMNNSISAIKAMHQVNRPELIQKQLFKSKDQLIRDLFIEMDAKNRAYYFILESGLLESFSDFCGERRPCNE